MLSIIPQVWVRGGSGKGVRVGQVSRLHHPLNQLDRPLPSKPNLQVQATVLQELRSSGILDLFFICAKSEVPQVSQPAVNCLVLIWQWYLRRSPTTSFSINQMSCCFPGESTPTAEGAVAAAAATTHKDRITAVANDGGRRPDPTQLWSVTPVVDYAVDRACDAERSSHAVERTAGATACQWQTGGASSHSLRSSTDSYFKPRPPVRSSTGVAPGTNLSPKTRVLPVRPSTDDCPNLRNPPVRAPPPPITPAAVRVSAGSLPAFCSSPEAVLAAPRPTSSASEQPAQEQAPPACLSPLLASTKPRITSAAASAATPVGGGQFVHQPQDWSSAASSCVAQEPSVTQRNQAASTPNATTAGEPSRKLPKQLTGSTALTASKNQQACRHSVSSSDFHHLSSSMRSPSQTGSYREVSEAPMTPDQLAGHFSRMRIDVEDIPQSSSSLGPAASKVPRAEQAGALHHTLPEGNLSQRTRDDQATPLSMTDQPVLHQHRQPDSSKHKHSCLDTDPEGQQWQSLPLSHLLPSVLAKTEGHNLQCYGGLERQSPAESPPTPDHRKPTKRLLHFSPLPVLQAQGHAFQSISGRPPA